ncbi:alpha/beta hydrolase [Chitinophaga agrisoli]|uniref:Alpha/beta hydrolase n=1 Tax=Chitinophaga agrisoli TaxID=2607653 RepID=A0A5B2W262_9BACT|nr:alpha/beta hydrolase [Chitinophaga agrisoli]KAA2245455.1 alpha/beta hydrolase [Chitinophaga agrisoli]
MKNTLILLTFICTGSLNVFCQQIKNNDTTILTSDSVALYVKKAGKGTPCIFVHGGPGAWSRSFEAMGGNNLERHLTMYYFDQRGCGRSQAAPNNDYSMDRMLADIESIRLLTGAEQVYIMGHSFGGILAFKYALKYPAHVRGLIMLNATLYIYNSLLSQIQFINLQLGTHFTVRDQDSLMSVFTAAKKALNEKGLEYTMLSDNKASIQKLDSIDSSPRNTAFARYAFSNRVYLQDFTRETAALQTPVLVIGGTVDHNIGPEHYKLFKFPHQQVKIIPGGHVLYYEKNKEFTAAVWNFTR